MLSHQWRRGTTLSLGVTEINAKTSLMKSFVAHILFLVGISIMVPAPAETSAYEAELSEASNNLRALYASAEQTTTNDHEQRHAIRQKLFEISKSLHLIEEEAAGANLALIRSGARIDQKLRLAEGIAKTLDLAQSMLDGFLDTNNQALWSAGLEAMKVSRGLLAEQRR